MELTRVVPSLRSRLQTALRLKRALRLVWQTAPRWTLVNAALVFVQSGLPLAALYLIKCILVLILPQTLLRNYEWQISK